MEGSARKASKRVSAATLAQRFLVCGKKYGI